jgi:multidrug efflux pump subunit AcrA (membrane-fusion protein)
MIKSRIRIWTINLIVLALVVGAGWWGWSALHPAPAKATITTATATTGNVQQTVSASGTVISPGDLGVSPLVSGTITSIRVKVGNHVTKGETLATLDGTSLAQSLAQAKSTLASEQIQYKQAEQAVINAQQSVTDQSTLNQSNVANYQASVDAAQKSLNDAIANESIDKTSAAASVASAQQSIVNAQTALSSAQINRDNYYNTWSYYGFTLQYCQNLNLAGVNTTAVNDSFSHCAQILSNDTALTNAQQAVAAAQQALVNTKANGDALIAKDEQNISSLRSALATAQNNQKISLQKDSQTVQSSNNSVTSAQTALSLLKAQYGITVDNPTAADFSVAQAALALAEKNFSASVVRAPVTGDIASITGQVGGQATTASSSTVGSVSGMFVITNVSALEVQAGFSESDAAKIKVGQSASIAFTALPAINAAAHVISIDLLPTTSSGATTYTVTYGLDDTVAGLKPGMTATVTGLIASVDNALSLPAQAVTTRNSGSFVQVVTTQAGKQVITQTPVEVGIQGDSSDQIISGIKEGTVVVLRQTTASSSSGFPASGVPAVTGGAGAGFGAGAGGGPRG